MCFYLENGEFVEFLHLGCMNVQKRSFPAGFSATNVAKIQ